MIDSLKRGSSKKKPLKVIGWREWVTLPELNITRIKAKVDTGARSSSLHAFHLSFYKRAGKEYVKFKVHPKQRDSHKTIFCVAPVLEYRKVKSSSGHTELRPVILTELSLLGECWTIEVTLTNRDEMGFRMLLGRESFRKRFLVDAGKSYYGSKTKRKV
ncbi:MAG: ATP-dependent zinc protease [Bdellovibrionales bacterium]|nr:ATP-dependent zinc protease [Bdellovibrionales bacterium]